MRVVFASLLFTGASAACDHIKFRSLCRQSDCSDTCAESIKPLVNCVKEGNYYVTRTCSDDGSAFTEHLYWASDPDCEGVSTNNEGDGQTGVCRNAMFARVHEVYTCEGCAIDAQARMSTGDRCDTASDCSSSLCEPVPLGATGATKRCVLDSPNPPCQISDHDAKNFPPYSSGCDAKHSDCFSDNDCTIGSCEGPDARPDCGGPTPPPAHNVCVQDACDLGELGGGGCGKHEVCVQPGAFGNTRNVCVQALCASDGDCSAGTNGRCEHFYHACYFRGSSGLGCVYDESECHTSADCSGERCDFNFYRGKMQCSSPQPMPPTPSVGSSPSPASPVLEV